MKSNNPVFGFRGLLYGAISGGCCFLSRTLFGSPLEMMHLIQDINFLPSVWLFNILSVSACFLMGICLGWIIESVVIGYNSGPKEACAYRGALYLSFSFFLFIIWFFVLFYARRLFLSFLISVLTLLSALSCSVEWSNLKPTRAAIFMYVDTIWMLYITFVSLSVWWGS